MKLIISEKTLTVSDLQNQIENLDEEKDLENLMKKLYRRLQKSVAVIIMHEEMNAPLEKERDNIINDLIIELKV